MMELTLNIVGRSAAIPQQGEPYEVELSGDAASLRTLASILSSGETDTICKLHVPSSASPRPYDLFLPELRVLPTRGPVVVAQRGDVLVIAGSSENLSILGSNITFLADQPVSSGGVKPHTHLEYYEGNSYLAEASLPLIITIELSIGESQA